MYIINERVWWGKAGGRTPHCRQAEADKKVIHVWLTELRRYHNLLLVWLQMLLRIQIKVPSPSPTCKPFSLPCPCLPVQLPGQIPLSISSGSTGVVAFQDQLSTTSQASNFHLTLRFLRKCNTDMVNHMDPSIVPEIAQDPHF